MSISQKIWGKLISC